MKAPHRHVAQAAAVLLATACAANPGSAPAPEATAEAEASPPVREVPEAPPDHLTFSEDWSQEAASDDAMTDRIRASAQQLQQTGPVPRVAFVDLRFPANARERESLDGYGVLRLTAVCRDAAELPPSRLFVRGDDGEIALTPIRGYRSQVPGSEADIVQVVGRERLDALYLIPLYLAARPGTLVVDFAKNRNGFVLGEFPLVPPDASYTFDPPTQGAPDPAALDALITREIPTFGAPAGP